MPTLSELAKKVATAPFKVPLAAGKAIGSEVSGVLSSAKHTAMSAMMAPFSGLLSTIASTPVLGSFLGNLQSSKHGNIPGMDNIPNMGVSNRSFEDKSMSMNNNFNASMDADLTAIQNSLDMMNKNGISILNVLKISTKRLDERIDTLEKNGKSILYALRKGVRLKRMDDNLGKILAALQAGYGPGETARTRGVGKKTIINMIEHNEKIMTNMIEVQKQMFTTQNNLIKHLKSQSVSDKNEAKAKERHDEAMEDVDIAKEYEDALENKDTSKNDENITEIINNKKSSGFLAGLLSGAGMKTIVSMLLLGAAGIIGTKLIQSVKESDVTDAIKNKMDEWDVSGLDILGVTLGTTIGALIGRKIVGVIGKKGWIGALTTAAVAGVGLYKGAQITNTLQETPDIPTEIETKGNSAFELLHNRNKQIKQDRSPVGKTKSILDKTNLDSIGASLAGGYAGAKLFSWVPGWPGVLLRGIGFLAGSYYGPEVLDKMKSNISEQKSLTSLDQLNDFSTNTPMKDGLVDKAKDSIFSMWDHVTDKIKERHNSLLEAANARTREREIKNRETREKLNKFFTSNYYDSSTEEHVQRQNDYVRNMKNSKDVMVSLIDPKSGQIIDIAPSETKIKELTLRYEKMDMMQGANGFAGIFQNNQPVIQNITNNNITNVGGKSTVSSVTNVEQGSSGGYLPSFA